MFCLRYELPGYVPGIREDHDDSAEPSVLGLWVEEGAVLCPVYRGVIDSSVA
jgi:hypothetical protein